MGSSESQEALTKGVTCPCLNLIRSCSVLVWEVLAQTAPVANSMLQQWALAYGHFTPGQPRASLRRLQISVPLGSMVTVAGLTFKAVDVAPLWRPPCEPMGAESTPRLWHLPTTRLPPSRREARHGPTACVRCGTAQSLLLGFFFRLRDA